MMLRFCLVFVAVSLGAADDPDWIQLARLSMSNYALVKAEGSPPDVFCSKKGSKPNGCHCWNDKGKATSDGDDCSSPTGCLIYDTKDNGSIHFMNLSSGEDLQKTLTQWAVPSGMVKLFEVALLTENATFTTFAFTVNPKTAHYEAHVGTARLHQGQRFLGYVYGIADGDLVQPYKRSVRAGDCHGTMRGQKPRGYTSDEIDKLRGGLASAAFKKAAGLATVEAKLGNDLTSDKDQMESFLEKWQSKGLDVVELTPSQYRAEPSRKLQSDPFDSLFDIIQKITGAWQSIVNAFKSSYSEQIVDKEFANGWKSFKAATRTFKGAGLQYDKADEFFADIRGMLNIPSNYTKDFDQQIQWIKFFDNTTWSSHNTQFSTGKGGSDTVFTMFARNRQSEQKLDVLFLTCSQEFKKADNYFVISESRSILGGIWSSTKLKFKKIPAGITDQDLMFVADYFQLLAYQQIALASGDKAPPDPQFPQTVVRPSMENIVV